MAKTIMVTGAASGIGAALSEYFAEQGYQVVISDLNGDAAEKLSVSLNAKGFKTFSHELDVSKQEQIESLSLKYPNVDILINNAGVQHVAKLESFPADKWRLLTDILLVGPAMLTRAVLPGMKSRGFGRIINIGSIHSIIASPYKSAYVAAKHGLLGFSKVIALETTDVNITINTICPSYVKTPLVEKQIAQQALEHNMSEDDVINKIMLEPMPKKEFIGMDELAGTVEYLVSESAKNMTGQTIVLDGGWTVR